MKYIVLILFLIPSFIKGQTYYELNKLFYSQDRPKKPEVAEGYLRIDSLRNSIRIELRDYYNDYLYESDLRCSGKLVLNGVVYHRCIPKTKAERPIVYLFRHDDHFLKEVIIMDTKIVRWPLKHSKSPLK